MNHFIQLLLIDLAHEKIIFAKYGIFVKDYIKVASNNLNIGIHITNYKDVTLKYKIFYWIYTCLIDFIVSNFGKIPNLKLNYKSLFARKKHPITIVFFTFPLLQSIYS